MARVPEVSVQLVAIDFWDDAIFPWHERALLEKVGEGGRWLAASPDYEVEILDLGTHRVIPLRKGELYPARVLNEIYSFPRAGADAISDERLAAARSDARALLQILGGVAVVPAGTEANWFYGDVAHPKFGETVDPVLLQSAATFEARGAIALVKCGDQWTMAQRVAIVDTQAWLDEKHGGPGRDPRILAVTRTKAEKRFISLREAMEEMSMPEHAGDWPFSGPSASMELLTAVLASGSEFLPYFDTWAVASGVVRESPAGHQTRELLMIFYHLVSFDQLNTPRLAGAELLARLILRNQRAVKRNPKNPDFKGLQFMTSSKLDTIGGVLVGEFAKWSAEEQKTEAFTMKQQRLYSEELEKRKKP